MELLLVTLASALAGFMDAIVGGGGLILVPALFATYVAATPATLLGTNKSASVWGTSFATWQFSRRIALPWRKLWVAVAVTWVGSWLGAYALTLLSPDFLRKMLPMIMLLVLGYTLARKDLGHTHAPRWEGRQETVALCLIGFVIGCYDGFFGPGTGSFFVFLMVRLLGYDFLNASACSKLLNATSNASALALFSWQGHVWWHLTLALAVANVAGSLLGTRLALRHGTGFVRTMFILVVATLTLKTGYDAFIR
ncbi:MAG: TSUP family transporter [Alphaproteobacteria bacterium]|nr:TSUP family transporter [Alphaproteobacteria bacterium]